MNDHNENAPESRDPLPGWRDLLLSFLFMGVVNLGGPDTQVRILNNYLAFRRRWLSSDSILSVRKFFQVLPGPETLQLAIYVGYVKRRIRGGVLAGMMFLLPGAIVIVFLAKLYVIYSQSPKVGVVLLILRPVVVGIITAGAITLAAATIKNFLLAAIAAASAAALEFGQFNLLTILLLAGLIYLLIAQGLPKLQKHSMQTPVVIVVVLLLAFPFIHPHWLRMSWLFFKTGVFSLDGAYAPIAFLQQGAVEQYRWIGPAQLLDAIALGALTPGPFMLFSTFVGYLVGGPTGAILATIIVFLPSFVSALAGARYVGFMEKNGALSTFRSGASAALVGVIIVVIFQLAPGFLGHKANVGIAVTTCLAVVLLKIDVALMTLAAVLVGVTYAILNA